MHPIFMRRHRIVMYASVMAPAGPQMSSEEEEEEERQRQERQRGTHVMPHSLNHACHGVLIFCPRTLYSSTELRVSSYYLKVTHRFRF